VRRGIVLGLLVGAGITIWWFGRQWFFLHDEWGIVFYRRQGVLDAFLAPVHGHLFAVVIGIYRILFATVGLHHYGAYRGVEIALHLLCAALLYLYARRRGLHPVLALLALSLFLFLGSVWEVVYWLASAGFVIPLITMLVTLLAWDGHWRGANVVTAVMAVVALTTYGVAVAVVVGLVVCALGQGRSVGRLAALGVPLLGWVTWFVALRPRLLPPAALRAIPGADPHGDVGTFNLHHLRIAQLPSWIAHSAFGAVAGLAGNPEWFVAGILVGVASIALVVWALSRHRLGWRAAGLLVALLAFWVLTGVSRVEKASPTASRYIYPAAVLLLMLATECLRGVTPRRWLLALAGVVILSGVALNVDQLHDAALRTAPAFQTEKVTLAQLEGCGDLLAPNFVPPRHGVPGVTPGPLRAAVRALGPPVSAVPTALDPICHLNPFAPFAP
jgi:hypothetical protein